MITTSTGDGHTRNIFRSARGKGRGRVGRRTGGHACAPWSPCGRQAAAHEWKAWPRSAKANRGNKKKQMASENTDSFITATKEQEMKGENFTDIDVLHIADLG